MVRRGLARVLGLRRAGTKRQNPHWFCSILHNLPQFFSPLMRENALDASELLRHGRRHARITNRRLCSNTTMRLLGPVVGMCDYFHSGQ